MLNKSVAVIDVRSSEITAVVAERGVNNTFIIKSSFTSEYDGYAEGQFLDVNGFDQALASVVKRTLSACGDKVKSVYVGVPGEFTQVVNSDNVISFSSLKKVTRSDVKALESALLPSVRKGWRLIRSGCLYYVLSDMRRVVSPVGMLTDSLRGRLCHYLCSSAYCDCVENCLSKFGGIAEINFIPSVHAEAMYLIPPYEVALAILSKVNLNSKEGAATMLEHSFGGRLYRYTASEVKEKLREALDGICETIEECRQNYTERNLDYKTLYMTGESALTVRGASDHISGRLVRTVSVISPQIPYYDKPQFSSLFSLIDMALKDRESKSFFRFF